MGYKKVFTDLAAKKRAALIPFFVIGDPDFDTSLAIVKAAIDAGADILELGIPFSDPIADGPTIQKADIRAITAGMTTAKAFDFIGQVKKYKDIPIGLLMYYNLIYQYGTQKFFIDCYSAGVNSVLVADLSIDDADEITGLAASAGLETVFMVTPVTTEQRMKLIASKTTGFIYAVSVLGVTGSRDQLGSSIGQLLVKLKKLTNIPVCVGFGVSKPEHAAAVVGLGADGVIIGSKLVSFIESHLCDKDAITSDISTFLSQIRQVIYLVG